MEGVRSESGEVEGVRGGRSEDVRSGRSEKWKE